jgi:hypothetical protein
MSNSEDNNDDDYNPESIANTRRWLTKEADKLALSNPNCGFLHSSLLEPEPFWEYDDDLSDLDEIGPF